MDGRFLALFSQISGQLGQIVVAFEKHNTLNEKNLNLSTQILNGETNISEKKEQPEKSILDSCLKEIIDSKTVIEKLQTEMLDYKEYKVRVEKLEQYITTLKSQGCDMPAHHLEVCCTDDKKYLCGCDAKPNQTVPPVVAVPSSV